jgi:hypothetical protein
LTRLLRPLPPPPLHKLTDTLSGMCCVWVCLWVYGCMRGWVYDCTGMGMR